MTRKTLFSLGLTAIVIAFGAQAVYETPFSSFVWYLVFVGGRVSWTIHRPNYDNNGSVWLFDLIAISVNAVVYFVAIYLTRRAITHLLKSL
jgi:hypothetical protein